MSAVQTSPLELSRDSEKNLALLVPVMILSRSGEDAEKDLREHRCIVFILMPCFCPVTVKKRQNN